MDSPVGIRSGSHTMKLNYLLTETTESFLILDPHCLAGKSIDWTSLLCVTNAWKLFRVGALRMNCVNNNSFIDEHLAYIF